MSERRSCACLFYLKTLFTLKLFFFLVLNESTHFRISQVANGIFDNGININAFDYLTIILFSYSLNL